MELIQGVRTKLALVSFSHGAIRVPLQQTLSYTPRITERNINEFDNLEVAQVVTTFDGCDVSFDYLDSDSMLVDSMFADVAPNSSVVIDDPSNYKKVNGYANLKGLDSGLIVASILIKAARAKGSPYSEPVKEEAKVTRDLSATNVIKIKGKAIAYDRIIKNSGFSGYQQAVPPNISTDIKCAATSGYDAVLSKTAVPYDGASGYDLWVLKNGIEVTTGYTMSASGFTPAAELGVNDVFEVFYLYTDTV